MKNMLAIAELITKQKVRKLDIFTQELLDQKSSKFKELFEAIHIGKVKNDRDASRLLYGELPTDPRYRQLKSRFKKRLLNTLLLVDQNKPHSSSYDLTFHNCQKDWSLINVLSINEAIEPAIQLAKNLLTTCEKYGFNSLGLEAANFICQQLDTHNNIDKKTILELDHKIKRMQEIQLAEMLSENALRAIKINLDGENPQSAVELSKQQLNKYPTSTYLFYNHSEAKIRIAWRNNDFSEVIQITDNLIDFVEEDKKRCDSNRFLRLLFERIKAQIVVKKFNAALESVKKCINITSTGSKEWIQVMLWQSTIYCHQNNLPGSSNTYQAVTKHKAYAKLPLWEKNPHEQILALAIIKAIGNTGFNSLHFKEKDFIHQFVLNEATYPAQYARLQATHKLIKIIYWLYKNEKEEYRTKISNLRMIGLKKLNRNLDQDLILITQFIYRREKKNFFGTRSSSTQRISDSLSEQIFIPKITPLKFNPISATEYMTLIDRIHILT